MASINRMLQRLDHYTLWAFNADAALGGRTRSTRR